MALILEHLAIMLSIIWTVAIVVYLLVTTIRASYEEDPVVKALIEQVERLERRLKNIETLQDPTRYNP